MVCVFHEACVHFASVLCRSFTSADSCCLVVVSCPASLTFYSHICLHISCMIILTNSVGFPDGCWGKTNVEWRHTKTHLPYDGNLLRCHACNLIHADDFVCVIDCAP